jgi:hypothetical protein
VLLVLDSLDEAADLTAQTPRLHELRVLSAAWRVVVTSRPAAWDAPPTAAARAGRPRCGWWRSLTSPTPMTWRPSSAIGSSSCRPHPRGGGDPGDPRSRGIGPGCSNAPEVNILRPARRGAKAVAEPLPARRRDLYRCLGLRLLLRCGPRTTPDPMRHPIGDITKNSS